MLLGVWAKYFGIIIGLTFVSLLITQLSAIVTGIISRTNSFIAVGYGRDAHKVLVDLPFTEDCVRGWN
jgi:ABC-type transport system involved in multi-copper enzyme maturation permease subunit